MSLTGKKRTRNWARSRKRDQARGAGKRACAHCGRGFGYDIERATKRYCKDRCRMAAGGYANGRPRRANSMPVSVTTERSTP